MPRSDRFGAVCGVVGILLLVWGGGSTTGDPESALEGVGPAYVRIVGTVLLIVFLGRLHGALRVGLGGNSWWPSVMLLGSAAVMAAILDEVMISLAESEPASDEADRVIELLGWLQAAAWAPGLVSIMLAGTVAALTSPALPTWLGGVGVAFLVVDLLMLVLGRVGVATLPGMLWLFIAAIVLVFRAPQPHAATKPAAAV